MKTDIETKNAVITGASLGIERGMLTSFVYVEFDEGSQQGFGGFDLTQFNSASHFIRRVLEIASVEEWRNLKGRAVRIKAEPYGIIIALGHFLKDEWFVPSEEF